MNAFGTQFIIINDIIQELDPTVFGGPNEKWLHLATVRRGLKEYMAFTRVDTRHTLSNQLKDPMVWIEEIDPHTVALHQIKDDDEWNDVVNFLKEAKLLEYGNRKEKHIDLSLTSKNQN